MPKHWKAKEIAIACKGYIAATLNPVKGADQDFVAFSDDLIQKMTTISPPDCDDGTYWKRGIRVYPYLRDNIFPDVQKFQKALRIVFSSNPTGVTEEEKVCMAGAVHCKETKTMEYKFKSYEPKSWKFYEGWVHLKKIPKFAYSSHTLAPDTPNQPTKNQETESVDSSKTSIGGIPSEASSRGSGRGQKAAVAAKVKAEKDNKKRMREEERDKKFAVFVDEMGEMKQIIKKKSISTILTRASKTTTDPAIKKKLDDKLVSLALAFLD